MTVIVNAGSTLTVTLANGLTLTSDSTVAAGGFLDGQGTITGPFDLVNDGEIEADQVSGTLIIDTGTFTNQGVVGAFNGSLVIGPSVVTPNLSDGTLTGGIWSASNTQFLASNTLSLETGLITTDDAEIDIGPSGSFLDFNSATSADQPIQDSMTVVGTGGILGIDGTNWTASGSFSDAGVVGLFSGATISAAGGLTVSATGDVTGTGAVASPLILDGTADATGDSSLTLQSTVSGAGTLEADAGSVLTLESFQTYTQTFVNQGTVAIANTGSGGTVVVAGSFTGSGTFDLEGGTSQASTTALELPAGVTNVVDFTDFSSFGEVILDTPSTVTGTLQGFADTDTIVVDGVIANTATMSSFGEGDTSGTLAISDGSSALGSLTLFSAPPSVNRNGEVIYTDAVFTATPNIAANNTTITVSGAEGGFCFRSGTRIATSDAEVPVERLVVGDRVPTHFAGEQRIVWIGHRTIDCLRHPNPRLVLPVRVAAHAFGPGQPRRDLFLSPDHAVFARNVLIPIKYLINGLTIEQVTVDHVMYFHVELEEHDVVSAEGLAAESYLDTGDRALFANGGATVKLFPDFSARTWEMMGCAPLVMAGSEVDKVRAMLTARAFAPEWKIARRA